MEQTYNSNNPNNEELTFAVLFRILNRNKIFISSFSIFIFILACFIGLTKKKVWQGYFSIVLESKSESSQTSTKDVLSNFNISNLGGLNISKKSLQTEVGILKSNSVLIPIYNYVNSENKKLNNNQKEISFSGWKKNLNIGLEKKTSILNVTYKDKNKEMILPVLKKISEAYQAYSGRAKSRSFVLGKKYLNDQISFFKEKSAKSSKNALTYAIDNNLTTNDTENKGNSLIGGLDLPEFGTLGNFLPSQTLDAQPSQLTEGNSLEAIRIRSSNAIRNIELQIQKIEAISNLKDLQYIGSTIQPLKEEGIPQILESIETELINLNTKYTQDDQSIKDLKLKRELYSRLLKQRTIGYLKAKKLAAESLMESSKRPKGVLVKGKELMREANRDKETLIELEDKLRILQLSEAKYEDPWELITRPTLGKYPVAPKKRKIAYYGLLIGLFLGASISYFKEKISRLIYEEKELENLSNTEIIKRFKLKDNEIIESPNEILIEELQSIKNTNINVIASSQLNSNYYEDLITYIKKFSTSSDKKIEIYSIKENFSKFNQNESIILLTSIGKITTTEVNNLTRRLEILNKKIDAIILFSD